MSFASFVVIFNLGTRLILIVSLEYNFVNSNQGRKYGSKSIDIHEPQCLGFFSSLIIKIEKLNYLRFIKFERKMED